MIRSKINVYARLKPKNSPKSKTLYEISDAENPSSTERIKKLTLTNKKQNENDSSPLDKIKSIIFLQKYNLKHTVSSFKMCSTKKTASLEFSKK